MNTMFLLMAQFNKALIPLEDIAQPYLGMTPRTAAAKHLRGELGLPLVRMTDSQKAPLCVRIQDLAEFIDKKAEAAKAEVLKSVV